MRINTPAADASAILGILGSDGATIKDSIPITHPEKN
jgi:hypothetical protein